jgi:sigma-B regulation protein RsbU (phosphoserine phosphatase)
VATDYDYPRVKPATNVVCFREACTRSSAGDLIDVFLSTGKRTNIVIANVSGRDAQAQGHAHYLRHVIRTLADLHSPGSLLEWLNIAFHRRLADFGTERSASLFVAALHDRCLTYASGGLGLALLIHANGQHTRLPLAGTMVGVKTPQRFRERSIAITSGDWLVLVTSGITRARNAQGTLFGARDVARNMFSAIRAGVDDPAACILDAARSHCGDGSFSDASVLCVRFS